MHSGSCGSGFSRDRKMHTSRKQRKSTRIWIALLAIPIAYGASCSITSHTRTASFTRVHVGDPESAVLAAMGKPSVREPAGHLFPRYASYPCATPCVERLWYENRLSMDIEAWSVELDVDRRVVATTNWNSP